MDLEATWQEHKKFIVSTGAFAIAFGLLSAGVAGIEANAETLAKRNAREQADLVQAMAELKGQEAAERGKKIALEKNAGPEILKTLTWNPDPRWALPKDEKKPSIAYLSRAAKVLSELKDAVEKVGATFPRKGGENLPDVSFEEGTNLDPVHAAEACMRVDVTRRIVLAALDAGVRKFTAVKQGEATYQKLEGTGEEGFLRKIPVTVLFSGTAQDLAAMLASFQKEGSFLELGQCRVQRPRDARTPTAEDVKLDIELELGALTIEKEAPADAASPTGPRPVGPKRRRD